jgi:hypothetical protein
MGAAEPAASIARIGFRRWYERQLIEAHLALVTCILAMVLAAASLEAFTFAAPLPNLAGFLLMFGVACAVAWLSWQRYRRAMLGAWRLGEAAVCRRCATYGRFEVLASGTTDGIGSTWLDVRCRKCSFNWRMPEPSPRSAR